jgi:succinyl-CoA synthetase alpha subunit
MGHAGAIISGGKGTATEKMAAMKKAGIHVVESPALLGETVLKALTSKGLLKSKNGAARKSKKVTKKRIVRKRKTARKRK